MTKRTFGTEADRKINCLLFEGDKCACNWNAWYSTPLTWICLNCSAIKAKTADEKKNFKWKGDNLKPPLKARI